MDPITCCLLGICCPPFSEGQREAYKKALLASIKDEAQALKVFEATYDDFARMTEQIAAAAKA